jgi:hypothetical protein
MGSCSEETRTTESGMHPKTNCITTTKLMKLMTSYNNKIVIFL